MTLEEAKKILEKEGFKLEKVDYESVPSDVFTKYESPDVVEAMKIVQKASYSIGMKLDDFDARKARLKKEYETKTTDSSYKINPELVDASKAFNDALLDEQAKKIEHLDELSASRNKIIVKQSKKISKLRKVIRDKDAVLSDVSEELRLSKVREENLTSVCQKYLKEIEKLRKKLASIVVNNVDAQALKSAESALGYKEKIIEKLKNQLHDLQQKYFVLMDERDQTVGELKAKLRNLKKPRIPTPEEACGEPCGEPKKSINTGDYISKEELMKIQEEDVRKITTPPFSPISEMRKGNGILDQMVVSADLGKGESYTSSVIIIPKETKPIEDEIMEGCKEMMRMNIKLMRDLLGE